MKKHKLLFCFHNYPLREAGLANVADIFNHDITDGDPPRRRWQKRLVKYMENEIAKTHVFVHKHGPIGEGLHKCAAICYNLNLPNLLHNCLQEPSVTKLENLKFL